MATRNEVKEATTQLKQAGVNAVMADSANYFANPIESMFTQEAGPRADVVVLSCTDHTTNNLLCVMRMSYLKKLIVKAKSAQAGMLPDVAQQAR